MPSGSVPTIAYQSEPYTEPMIDSRQITPIQEYIDRDKYDLSDFAPAAIAYFTVDNTLYAMPCGLAVPLMYYNKIPFREAGLDPDQPPRDLDEARAVSEKLVQRDAAGNVTRYGFTLDIHPWYVELTESGAGELYVNNDNGRAGVATEVTFDNEAGQKLFQWWYGMVHDGLLLNVGWDPSGANSLLAVGARRGVMVLSTSAVMRSVVDVLAKGIEGIELGVAPVPGIPGRVPEGSPGVYSRSLWIMSSRPKKEQDAAWTFIKWFTEPEQQAEWFAGSGYLPVRNSAYDLPAARTSSPSTLSSRSRPTCSPRQRQRPLPWDRSSAPSSRYGMPSGVPSRACCPELPPRTKRWRLPSSRPTRPSVTTTAVWAIRGALSRVQGRQRLQLPPARESGEP